MKPKKASWEREFDEKFYLFARDYEVQFKSGNFTGSGNAKDLGKKIKSFISQELKRAERRGIKKGEHSKIFSAGGGGVSSPKIKDYLKEGGKNEQTKER